MEDPTKILKDSLEHIQDLDVDSSDHSGKSLCFDRIHQRINLSLKLLWCTCATMMQKEE